MDRLLAIEGLAKHFGPIVAVDGVSFTVERGEVLGFLGPNGAGKSTTMRMITGYLPPMPAASRSAASTSRKDPIEVRRRIGYLPEGAPRLWRHDARGAARLRRDAARASRRRAARAARAR